MRCVLVDLVHELTNLTSSDLVNASSLPSRNPHGCGRPVCFAGSGGDFLGGQVLFNDALKTDGHGDDSRPSTCIPIPDSASR